MSRLRGTAVLWILLLLLIALLCRRVVAQSGSGNATAFAVCADNTRISIGLFDCLHSAFQCESNRDLLFDVFALPSEARFVVDAAAVTCATPADYFDPGEHMLEVVVCVSNGNPSCDGARNTQLAFITLDVERHSGRLFPFGVERGDHLLSNTDDSAQRVTLQQGFPLFHRYHTSIHLSTNGLASFGQPYLSWFAIPFPYGRNSVPVVAPFWADIDFRNSLPFSGLYHQVYSMESTQLAAAQTRHLLQEFTDRLTDYSSTPSTFDPTWMLVATWQQATPFYGQFNSDETLTFQMVLATDYIQSFVFFYYQDFNWQQSRRHRVVTGYDARDLQSYLTVRPPGSPLSMDRLLGNSGQPGAWFFNLTAEQPLDSDGLCIEWSQRQMVEEVAELAGLSCPCTSQQVLRDWRFWFAHRWGLSSRANCATMLFSRATLHTIECCYDDDGSLLLGPLPGAGTYKLVNPLVNFAQYTLEDSLPYQYCCEDTDRCATYYQHRPYDDCSTYTSPRRWFIWGDPHFISVDGRQFTFNGIGEYLLLDSPANGVSLQARFTQFTPAVNGTVTSAVVLRQGGVSVQVQLESGGLVLYVGAQPHSPPTLNSVLVVSESDVTTLSDSSPPPDSTLGEDSLVFVQSSENGSITLTTPSSLALTISPQTSFLSFAVELPAAPFTNSTRGLLGVPNGNPDDDFTTPSGEVLSITTDAEIFAFGLLWHVEDSDSNFEYFAGESYDLYNTGYAEFSPSLLDPSQASPDVQAACSGDTSCIYDAMVTGDMQVGMSSMAVAMDNEDLSVTLDNRPPTITGSRTLYITAGASGGTKYNVTDSGDDGVLSVALRQPAPQGFSDLRDGNSVSVLWSPPAGVELPSERLTLVATDTRGASTAVDISVILCGCLSGGECVPVADTGSLQYNANGHFKQECDCPDFFAGESCETDQRGCGFAECPAYAQCEDAPSLPAGYTCSNCSAGYSNLNTSLNKCTDIDECADVNTCSQGCNNTEGSFLCVCTTGYTLGADGFSCIDVDECALGTTDCEQLCNNTIGGYQCSCVPGYTLTGRSNCTFASCAGSAPVCDHPSMCGVALEPMLQCVCPPGSYCEGECTGDAGFLTSASQACNMCGPNSFGVECSQTCDCLNSGVCDPVHGCLCVEGFTGRDCSIEVNAFSPEFLPAPPPFLETRWDLQSGATVLTVSARDNDSTANAGSLSYSLPPSSFPLMERTSDGAGVFSISSEGRVSLTEDLLTQLADFSRFVLTVAASDGGQPTRTSTAIVTVIPRPVPTITVEPTIVINESLPSGNEVAMVTCSEIGVSDEPTELRLSLSSSGNESANFRVSNSSILLAMPFDFERLSTPVFNLSVTCSNRYSLSASQLVTVEIINTDDNPFLFSQEAYDISILENATRAEEILTVSAFDADHPSASITYSLSGSEDFGIVPASGVVYVRGELDRERQPLYTLQVLAELEAGGGQLQQNLTANLTVSLLDVNDNAPEFERQLYVVNLTTRARRGDLAVSVVARDNDTGANGNFTYSLEPSDAFVIDEQSGEVLVNASLQPRSDFILTVSASDTGNPPMSGSAVIDVYVFPAPDRVSFAEAVVLFSVSEEVGRGALVGRVEASVLDVTNTTLNSSQVLYQIMGNATDVFSIDPASGEIFLLALLDYEAARMFDFIVEASTPSDPIVRPGSLVVEIAVLNINDNAPSFVPSFYAQAIEEFSPLGTSVLTVFALDPDPVNTTYTLSGADSEPFTVDPLSGVVTTTRELDVARDYRFLAVVEDGGSPALSSQAVVYVSVTRSTSVTPAFDRESYVFDISENATAGSYVGTVVALTRGNRTANEFPHLSYGIRMPDPASNGSTLFHIDAASGDISTLSESAFDRESRNNFVFYVEVFDADSNSSLDNATVQVRILDANDNAPQFSQPLYTRVINSAHTLNSFVLNVSATDMDSGTNSDITYSISAGNFSIDQTGAVFLSAFPLTPGDYRLTVEAVDSGTPQLTGSAVVFIAVIPALPTAISFTEEVYTFQVPEDVPLNGTLVGRVQAIDSALNFTLSDVVYSTANATECFHIDPVDGEVRVSCSLDRELQPQFELGVVATAQGAGVQGHARLVVSVLDVNDNAPTFTLDVYTQVIDDRYGNQTAILEFPVEATDPDAGANGTVRYTLLPSSDAALFRINASTGELFLAQSTIGLGDYRLTVQGSDLGEPLQLTATALVLICVTRAGDPLVDFLSSQAFSVAENAPPGSPVGVVQLASQAGLLIDPLEFPNNLLFEIVAGDSLDDFVIDAATGVVSTLVPLDRETATQHVIVVDARFPAFGILVGNASFTISVLDVNDVTPTFIPTIYSAITNNTAEAGLVLLTVQAVDIDTGSNAAVNFSIEPATPFSIRSTNTSYPNTFGELYIASAPLAVRTYVLSITASDDGSPSLNSSATVSIIVEHGFITFDNDTFYFTFVEETAPNAVVGSVSVTPPLASVIFAITGGNAGSYFTINPFTGVIRSALTINREANTEFNLTVEAISEGLEAVYSTVLVSITDINDNPPFFSMSTYTAVFPVNATSVGDVLVTVEASDADQGLNSDIVFSVGSLGNTSYQAFNIDPSTGVITYDQLLVVGTYTLRVFAADRGSPTLSNFAIVVLNIRPLFPAAVAFTQSSYAIDVPESTRSGAPVGSVAIQPLAEDIVPFVRFSAVSDGVTIGPSPEVSCSSSSNATGPRTLGCITAIRDFDFEQVQSYTFNVTVSLDGTTFAAPSLSSTVEVRVQVLDENDNFPVFIDFPDPPLFPNSRVRQDEEQESDVLVFDINATDADSGENARLTYEILNTDLAGKFYISNSTGMLFAVAGLDREEISNYFITIRVSDHGNPVRFAQRQLEYILVNVNDNDPILTSGFNYSVPERLPPASLAFTLESADADEVNPNIRYTLLTHGDIFRLPNPDAGEVTTRVALDFEAESSYTVTVQLRDSHVPAEDRRRVPYNITVHVLNEPDNVPVFNATSYSSSVAPVLADSQTVASVFASDADGDTIRYSIASTVESGNNGTIPALGIEALTGRIYSLGPQTLIPEAGLTITVQAFDFSRFNLSAQVSVTVTVLPEQLQFTQQLYNASIIESFSVSTEVVRVPISPLSVSSDISFSLAVTSPSSAGSTFSSTPGEGGADVAVILAAPVDRENIDSYSIEITAFRPSTSEQTTVMLAVTITDDNDNIPVFTDLPNSVLAVNENVPARTQVSKANATDADIDRNGEIFYRFENPPSSLPFSIAQETGVIQTVGTIDYEEQSSYSVTVLARDRGSPSLSATNTYIVNIRNLNDNFPQLAGNAYFGEVYSRAAVNDFVRHTLLDASDADDPTGTSPLNFKILFPVDSPQFGQDYLFEVAQQPPYNILIKRLAPAADDAPQLLELDMEVSDEGNLTSVYPLYISVFTQRNLMQFVVRGVTESELLSCADIRTSVCELRRVLGQVFQRELGSLDPITFYNESVETSATDRTVVTVSLFGWYGNLGSRENNGELSSSSLSPPPVQYIDFSAENGLIAGVNMEQLFAAVASSTELNLFDFSVDIPMQTTPTPPVVTTEVVTTELVTEAGGGVELTVIVAVVIAVGGVVAVLLIVLVIVLVVVCGRRKKEQPKKKSHRRPSDPYERGYNQLQSRPKRKEVDEQHTGGSDLAYETMYDDDELTGTQTMPWFDPKYLAHDTDEYHADSEQTAPRPGAGGMRATVDGDARRGRRRSSDDGGSVTELDPSPYLEQYQQSTPMQPGQRMGEFEMFARPRDDDKPYRPSLSEYQWRQQQQQQQQQRAQQQQHTRM